MLQKKNVIVFIISLFSIQTAFALENQKHSILLQPNFSLNNFIPDDMFGTSLQYEYSYSNRSSLLLRAMVFKNPALYRSRSNAQGFAISTEYRMYFKKQPTGFHIGPIVEWVHLERKNTSSNQKDIFDIGCIFGYRRDIHIVTTDISLKMAWYGPPNYPKEGLFPKGDSSFNTTMLVSFGFKIF